MPAATLIVLRDRAGGPPDILMVERSAAMAFAGGALVFPGGRVEAADAVAGWPGDRDDGAARMAAIRETIEEAGVAIAVEPAADAPTIARWRAALAGGAALATIVAADGARLDPAALQPFARWRPAHRLARIYDTRFYLARLPAGAPPPLVDATENVRTLWATAADTLATIARGEAHAIFPTRRTLERLARFPTAAAAFADARRYPPAVVTPWVETRGGVEYLCIPDDLGYPIAAEPLTQASRD